MAPTSCRHTLIWSLPTLAVLLTFLWYKSRRGSSRSDPGGTAKGTRKAKKQEQNITQTTSSLLAEGSEASVKKRNCTTSREQAELKNCAYTTETGGLLLGYPEVQQSESNIGAKITEKLKVESTASPSRKNFSSDTSKNISLEQSSEKACTVAAEKCNDTYYKNELIELFNTSIHSGAYSANSDTASSSEENSVCADSFPVHFISEQHTPLEIIVPSEVKSDIAVSRRKKSEAAAPKETNSVTPVQEKLSSEIINIKNTDSSTQEINPEIKISQKTNCKSGVLQWPSYETGEPKEINSHIAFSSGADSGIAVLLESAAETVVSAQKETNFEITNPQETNNIGAAQETGFNIFALNERGLELASSKQTNSEVADPKETKSEVVVPKETKSEVAVPKETNSEVAVPKETNSEVAVPKETNLEVAVPKETNSEVAVPKETNSEVAVPKETNSEVAVPKETNSEVAVPKETNSEVAVPKETNSKVAVPKETNSKVAIPKETNSEVVAPKQTNSEVVVPKQTNCEVAVSKETNCEVAVSKETNCEVAVSKETNCEVAVSKETNSEVAVPRESHSDTHSDLVLLNESDCDIGSDLVVSQESACDLVVRETVFELTAPQRKDSKVTLTPETHIEVTILQDSDPKYTIGEISHTNTCKSEEDHLSIRSQCSDCSNLSYSSVCSADSEEVVSVIVSHFAEDLSSSTVLPVSCNTTDKISEEVTMPESIREKWTLENTSDIQTESASETHRKDTVQTCGESNTFPQNEGSEAAQSTRMQTPPPANEVSDGVDAAATSSNCGLEGKLAALELGKGRDSANHSPAEVMLASPSASSYSDEGSSDSGKGCSDLATPPSRTPASGSSVSGDATALSVFEFVLPQHLVGRLIGRHGAFVHQIKAKTNASILIKRHPDTPKLKICAVEGTQLDIEGALEMIRKKFPLKHYPSITLEQVCFVPPAPVYPVLPECLQLMLVEGVSNDVILSSLVTPGHFFLQQPTHPTFPALNRLNTCMNVCYSEPNVPLLPTPVDSGVICAAPTMGGWYRAQVVSVEAETSMCEVKFVDYGGYLSLEHTALRQIRSDFMTLPFQASECFLANVIPAGGEEATWSADAAAVMEELTHGQVLQAQVCDYTEENIPNVFLYAVHCNQVVLVNQELVLRGLAEWWQTDVNEVSCL